MVVKSTREQRCRVVILREFGFSWRKIAEEVQLSHHSTASSIYKNYLKNGGFDDAKRSGCPRKLNDRDRRQLRKWLTNDNKMSLEQLRVLFNSFSEKTICKNTLRKELHRMGLRGRAAAKKIYLKYHHRRLRMQWASTRRTRSVEQWERIIFSDECRFGVSGDGRVHVWRESGKRFCPKNTIARSSSRFSIMFWGCISAHGWRVLFKTPAKCTARSYIDLLERAGINNLGSFIFQDDNCPIHRAGVVTEWFADHGVTKEDWPPYSPDLSPIENVWAYIKRQIRCMKVDEKNLEETVLAIWESIPNSYFKTLYKSLPKRVNICCKNRGFPTSY